MSCRRTSCTCRTSKCDARADLRTATRCTCHAAPSRRWSRWPCPPREASWSRPRVHARYPARYHTYEVMMTERGLESWNELLRLTKYSSWIANARANLRTPIESYNIQHIWIFNKWFFWSDFNICFGFIVELFSTRIFLRDLCHLFCYFIITTAYPKDLHLLLLKSSIALSTRSKFVHHKIFVVEA